MIRELIGALDLDIRTDADFRDPLDDAIVQAALSIHAFRTAGPHYPGDLSPLTQALYDAVQAKLDASKPKTVDEVLAEHALWVHVKEGQQPSKCACGHEFKLGESFVRHQSDALREAGLLNE